MLCHQSLRTQLSHKISVVLEQHVHAVASFSCLGITAAANVSRFYYTILKEITEPLNLYISFMYYHIILCLMTCFTCFRDSLQRSRERQIQNCYNLFNQSKIKPKKDYNVNVCLIKFLPTFVPLFQNENYRNLKTVFEMRLIMSIFQCCYANV